MLAVAHLFDTECDTRASRPQHQLVCSFMPLSNLACTAPLLNHQHSPFRHMRAPHFAGQLLTPSLATLLLEVGTMMALSQPRCSMPIQAATLRLLPRCSETSTHSPVMEMSWAFTVTPFGPHMPTDSSLRSCMLLIRSHYSSTLPRLTWHHL